MSNEKMATDVLVSIDEKLSTVIKILQSYDNNLKLILNKINSSSSIAELPKKTTENNLPLLKTEVNIDPSKVKRDTNIVENSKKIPVIQRVVDKNGKDVFMADVHILDLNDILILKLKTNAIGKWQAQLKPGDYKVKISKTDSLTMTKNEIIQNIKVNDVDNVFTLENFTFLK